jgi:hypothetical protein
MTTLKIKNVISAAAAVAVLTMVLSSVFADVTSVARSQFGSGHGQSFAAFVTALGL